jgi:type IV pilus assembly protein PilM
MDCQILDDDKVKDNKMAIMVAVAKKDIIKERLAFIASLGLQANFVGLNAIALANVVTEFQEDVQDRIASEKKEAFAVIDMGETKTTVVIFREQTARFTREISIGGKDLTQKIMGLLGCHFQEAEEVKCKPGDRKDEIFATCQPVLSSLVSEIRLSFDYFTSEDGAKVSKTFLTGHGASLVGIRDFFVKELEMDVAQWKPSRALEFGEQVSAEAFFANINQLSVALGLAVIQHD